MNNKEQFELFKQQVLEWRDAHEDEYINFAEKMSRDDKITAYAKLYLKLGKSLPRFQELWHSCWSGAKRSDLSLVEQLSKETGIAQFLVEEFQQQKNGTMVPLLLSWMFSGAMFEVILGVLENSINKNQIPTFVRPVIPRIMKADVSVSVKNGYRSVNDWKQYADDLAIVAPKSISLKILKDFIEANGEKLYVVDDTVESPEAEVDVDQNPEQKSEVEDSNSTAPVYQEAVEETITTALSSEKPVEESRPVEMFSNLLLCENKISVVDVVRKHLLIHRRGVDMAELLLVMLDLEIYDGGDDTARFVRALKAEYEHQGVKIVSARMVQNKISELRSMTTIQIINAKGLKEPKKVHTYETPDYADDIERLRDKIKLAISTQSE
jgi:hypothetical protein